MKPDMNTSMALRRRVMRLEAENEKLQSELQDWRDCAKHAAGEMCGDEKHCTCVPLLRKTIKDMKEWRDPVKDPIKILTENDELAKLLELAHCQGYADGVKEAVSNTLYGSYPFWIRYRDKLVLRGIVNPFPELPEGE